MSHTLGWKGTGQVPRGARPPSLHASVAVSSHPTGGGEAINGLVERRCAGTGLGAGVPVLTPPQSPLEVLDRDSVMEAQSVALIGLSGG